jgi:hypothetical protein
MKQSAGRPRGVKLGRFCWQVRGDQDLLGDGLAPDLPLFQTVMRQAPRARVIVDSD